MMMFHPSCWCSRSLGYHHAPSAAALSSRGMFSTLLQRPEILFESNHLLVVNKPVGWHSMPNNDKGQQQSYDQNKCLLRYLVQAKLGGGSNREFLKPLHRIDQPCSGVLLLGKTSKAASRIQSAWQGVEKTYLVVVERRQHSGKMSHQPPITDDDPIRLLFCNNSITDQDDEWHRLSGFMLRRKSRYHGTTSAQQQQQQQTIKGWSVTMIPDPATSATASRSDDTTSSELLDDPRTYRHCTLEWRRVLPKALSYSSSIRENNNQTALLEVRTSQGARHMIRALFSCQGRAAVAGDLRYGAERALPDRSVALHAYTVRLPPTVKLGTTGALQQRRFVAPFPPVWAAYFGITQDDKMRYTPS